MMRADYKASLPLFKRFLLPHWRGVLLMAAGSFLVGTLMSLRPLVIAPALDAFMETHAEPADSLGELTLNNLGPTLSSSLGLAEGDVLGAGVVVVVLFIIFTLIIIPLDIASYWLLARVRMDVRNELTIAVHRHLLTLPLAYFQRAQTGDLVSRLTFDVTKTAAGLDRVAQGILNSAAQIFVTLVILFITDPLFTIALLGLGFFHMLVTRLVGHRVREKAKAVAETRGSMSATILETFVSIRLIKSFAAENHDASRVAKAVRTVGKAVKRLAVTKYLDGPMRFFVDAIITSVILMMVFYAVSEGRLTLPAAGLFFFLAQRLNAPMARFFGQFVGIQDMLGSAERVNYIFNAHNNMKRGTKKAEDLQDSIVLKDVSFEYEQDRPVLDGISFTVKKGETVALVGSSGAGKSTLADLILRLHDVTKGSICYDGIDIRDFRQRSFRQKFGVVAQECLLFNESIRNNVVFNSPEFEERLQHAIWVANAEEFIEAQSDGIDTIVGDRGIRLSGGQRQRIAIARAVYARPSILILDEATSALDTESERAVQKAIDRVRKEMTTIVIAHRLSTISGADKIVVLNNGRVEATARHEKLLRISPTYSKLYNLQFQGLADQQETG